MLLDTDVLSELVRPVSAPAVLVWAKSVTAGEVCTTAITEAEMRFGIERLPHGRRRAALAQAIETILRMVVGGRVLPFDRSAATIYGTLAAQRQRAGRSVQIADLQIAAIARARNVQAIATRNTTDFADCGVPLVNPWQPSSPGRHA